MQEKDIMMEEVTMEDEATKSKCNCEELKKENEELKKINSQYEKAYTELSMKYNKLYALLGHTIEFSLEVK